MDNWKILFSLCCIGPVILVVVSVLVALLPGLAALGPWLYVVGLGRVMIEEHNRKRRREKGGMR